MKSRIVNLEDVSFLKRSHGESRAIGAGRSGAVEPSRKVRR